MADNVTLPGTGIVVSAEDITTLNGAGVTAQEVQRMLLAARTADGVAVDIGHAEDLAHAAGDAGVMLLAVRKDTAVALAGTDADYIPLIVGSDGGLWVRQSQPLPAGETHIGEVAGSGNTVTITLTRPADTTAYAANDAISDSTSAPAVLSGTGFARISGGSGIITDILLVDSSNQTTPLQCELHIFDATVTSANDNAAFTITDGVAATEIGYVTFLASTTGDPTSGSGNRLYHLTGLNIAFKCVTTTTLYFLFKALNAYTPTSAEQLTARIKVMYLN